MPSRFDAGKFPHNQVRGMDKVNIKRAGVTNGKQYGGVRPSLLRPRSVNSSFESSGNHRVSPANSSLDHSGYLSDRTDHRKQIVGCAGHGRGMNVMVGANHIRNRGGGKDNIYQVRR